MRRSGLILFSAAIAVTSMTFPAGAADKFLLDASHAGVLFSISHLGFSKTYGRFNTIDGAFTLDADAPEKSSVVVTMDAASIDTNHKERDEHLRGKDFFDVAQYPNLTYKSTSVKRTGDNSATVTGDLSMHGVTKPVPLEVTLTKTGPHPRDATKTVAGFSARGTLKRSDFGIVYGVPMVGDEVELIIDVETVKQP